MIVAKREIITVVVDVHRHVLSDLLHIAGTFDSQCCFPRFA